MDEKVSMVLNAMKIATSDNEGVVIEPLELDDGILTIRYSMGTNEECPECVMQPTAFRDMVIRMCKTQAPYVIDVEVVPAS
jgi:hypothetical protein